MIMVIYRVLTHCVTLQRHGLWKDAEDVEEDMAKAERDVASRAPSPVATPRLVSLPESAHLMYSDGASTSPSRDGSHVYDGTSAAQFQNINTLSPSHHKHSGKQRSSLG